MSGAGRADRAEDQAPGPEEEPGADASADKASAEDKTAEDNAQGAAPAKTGSGGGRQAARRPRRKRSFWREFPILVVVALLLAVVIKTYAIQAFFIPSGSMENTLEINDRVLVNKLVYDVRGIHRGDIVVFNGDGSWDPGPVPVDTNFLVKFADGFASMFGFGHPGDILIKRVIGLPGDHVACCDAQNRVTVNGVPLSEKPYLYPGDLPSESRFSITVPPGRLWVMGDHRLISDDSRDHLGDPGERGGRPGVRHHLAAEPVAVPADSRHLRAAQAERHGRRRPKNGNERRCRIRPPSWPSLRPPHALQPGPAANFGLRRGSPANLASAPDPNPTETTALTGKRVPFGVS